MNLSTLLISASAFAGILQAQGFVSPLQSRQPSKFFSYDDKTCVGSSFSLFLIFFSFDLI
jgi:hypothetical protein